MDFSFWLQLLVIVSFIKEKPTPRTCNVPNSDIYNDECRGKKEIVIFYTDILIGKVVLWCFFSSEMSEKIHNSTFQVKISV